MTDPTFSDDYLDDDDVLEAVELVDLHSDLHVTAVLVAHDGERWLPTTLACLAGQDRPADTIVAIDNGSKDSSRVLLTDALGADAVVSGERSDGFGKAVAAGLAHAPRGDFDAASWIWLLHDDSAPDPDALRRLLDAVDGRPSIAMAGPKILGWIDRTHLLEVGVTIGRGGRRDTGLERHERDQGQHDAERDVMAVSTAGLLIRRDVWDVLGGFDPALPLFRDDLDLGWRANAAGHRVVVVPRAVVHHAEASTHLTRASEAVEQHPRRADRAHAMTVLLAHASLPGLFLRGIALTLASLLRTLFLLIGKDVPAARDEIGALGEVLFHPRRLARQRSERSRTRTVKRRETAHLLASSGGQLRQSAENATSMLSSRESTSISAGALESGPTDDDSMAGLVDTGPGPLKRAAAHPGAVLAFVMFVLALIAARDLFGRGRLLGGALFPAPNGVHDWWAGFVQTWHATVLGSTRPAAPSLPVLATLGTPLLGRAPTLIDLLLLACVPLAAISAYVCARGVIRSTPLRVWAAVTYAVLPAVTGAVASGRIGTALLAIGLPPLLRALAHAAGLGAHAPGTRSGWGAALLLAVLAAFVPLLWLFVAVGAVIAVATFARERTLRLRLLLIVMVPLVLWMPWTLQLFAHPQQFFLESGIPAPGLADPGLHPSSVFVLDPGGPGTPAAWVGLGVLLMALAALLRPARRTVIAGGWCLALAAFVVALISSWLTVTPIAGGPVAVWPGPSLLLAGAGLIVAAAVGAEGGLRRLSVMRFSWRQLVAGVVTALAILGPLVAAFTWVSHGSGDPLDRRNPVALPAFAAAQAVGSDRPRTLVLQGDPRAVRYSIVRAQGQQLGDAEVASSNDDTEGLSSLVADIASGRGAADSARLLTYGVRFVLVPAPVPPALRNTLDSVPALTRASSTSSGTLWRVAGVSARARFVPTAGLPTALPSTGEADANGSVPKAWPGGRIVLAEVADGGWHATLNGRALKASTAYGWAQAFDVPKGAAGTISVTHAAGARPYWLAGVAVVLVVAVVLSLPARRPDEGVGEDA